MTAKLHLTRESLFALLRQMLRVRRFEEKCDELYQAEKIRGFLHLGIGEEAICTAVMANLSADDAIVATYREHGHALVRGVPMREIMAEMYGKAAGCSHGRGGSMHLFSAPHRFYGGYAIVAGGIPLAAGLALADKMQAKRRVTVCFLGDGAVAEGVFHETMNLAALRRLPVLFVCENNLYAMGTRLDLSESETDLCGKVRSYRIHAEAVNGMDVVAVDAAARRAISSIQDQEGPFFLECKTYRFRAHSLFDPQLYRSKEEVEEWKKQDPIPQLSNWMLSAGMLHQDELTALETGIQEEVADAVRFAEKADWEPVGELTKFVYAETKI
jgi:pyruvate dehydrogenase E1 component alpha subunit